MKSIVRRVRRLERVNTDATGLVPGSKDWNIFWRQRILDLLDGKPDNGGRVPIEVFDEMLAEGEALYGLG